MVIAFEQCATRIYLATADAHLARPQGRLRSARLPLTNNVEREESQRPGGWRRGVNGEPGVQWVIRKRQLCYAYVHA